MRVEDLLFRPFVDGLMLPAPVQDPFRDPEALWEEWLMKVRHDPVINSACLVIQTSGGNPEDPEVIWNTGVLVFRRIRSLSWSGYVAGLSDSSDVCWHEVGESVVVPVDGGFVFQLIGEVVHMSLRVEFESGEFYGGFVSGVGQHTSVAGEDGALLAPWVVNWDSRIRVTCMSTLGEFGLPNFRAASVEPVERLVPRFDVPERFPGFTVDQVSIPEQGVVPVEDEAWFRGVGGVGRVGPFLWRVLAVEDSRVLLITEHVVAVHRFDALSNDWVRSELRAWMHGELLDGLGDTVRASIIPTVNVEGEVSDLLFLLSVEEAGRFFSGDADRAASYRGHPFWWWLCPPGKLAPPTGLRFSPRVGFNGFVGAYGSLITSEYIGVRPVMWLGTDYWGS